MAQRGECGYCGRVGEVVMDHVVPRSRGGPDHPRNLLEACARCNAEKSGRLPSEWRRRLPRVVEEIERRVCADVEVRIRTRRGPHPLETDVWLPCAICGTNVAAAYMQNTLNGWLVWYADWETDEVRHVETCCYGPMMSNVPREQRCLKQLDARHSSLHHLDNAMMHFAGDIAVEELSDILRFNPKWTEQARHRLVDIFSELQRLPSCLSERVSTMADRREARAEDARRLARDAENYRLDDVERALHGRELGVFLVEE